ncbi:hypothetical protein B0T24DRAFT_684452 [Lasiosphaeria ovina]|uniref:Uncharacterized protein n=1 Tax=Lasiosphaeria ovina TaxID=92902 RepID=A0AAE0MYV4_9PEZI|nr:hypothetical protein B0T24DRAFT_684452 [Lasiosphaeria ovina]
MRVIGTPTLALVEYMSDVPAGNYSELSQAINSMFRCDAAEPLAKSRWFTRGLTLQGLLAPSEVNFYAADWSFIGSKVSLGDEISSIAVIHPEYLNFGAPSQFYPWLPLRDASVAVRMSWLGRRTTSKIKDMAYYMLGIFDANMPLIYGEGPKAFQRLQHEIIKFSDDHSIFCWNSSLGNPDGSIVALDPVAFLDASGLRRSAERTRPSPFGLTNAGLSI